MESIQRLVDGMSDGAVLTDVHGRITHVNEACTSMFGYERDDLIGRHVSLLDAGSLPLGAAGAVADMVREVTIWRAPAVGIRKSGTNLPLNMTVIDMGGSKSGSGGYAVFFRDAAVTTPPTDDGGAIFLQAKAAVKAKRQIVSLISHEFRTPLTAIVGFAKLLLDHDGMQDPDVHRYLEHILESAQRLSRTAESVIEYAQLEGEEMAPQAAVFEVADRVREFTAAYAGLLARRGVAFRLEFDPEIPDAVVADGGKVLRVLDILLDNAQKFTREGAVRLRVAACRDCSAIEFHVSDTGVGFSEGEANHLFLPFWQAEEPISRSHPGLGMGLAIADRLARILGGALRAFPDEAGSTFVLTVPFEPIAEA